MASAGTISVDVQARIQNFVDGLNKCTAQAESFGRNLNAVTGKNETAFSRLSTSVAGVTKDFKQITQGIILAQAFYTSLSAIQEATAAMWEYVDAVNYAETTFSNLFKSSELAEEFVAVLQAYAARSPFDFTDVEKAAVSLRAYGIESKNLMFVMQGIGNLASVTGNYSQTFERVARAIGQINAKGKLMGEEMRQLAEAGIDVSAVYARLGTSADKLADDAISSADAINAIVDVMQTNYSGALEAANTTVQGMLANLRDLALMVSASILQPAYEGFRRALYGVSIEVNKFQEAFQKEGLAAAISQAFGPEVLNRIQQFIAIVRLLGNTLLQMAAPAMKLFGMYAESLTTILIGLLTIMTPIIRFFAGLVNSLMSTAEGARALQVIMMGLASAFVATKLAAMGALIVEMFGKVLEGLVAVTSAATLAQEAYNVAITSGAKRAVAAGAAFRAFSASLKANPILLVASAVGVLITAILGLRHVLGNTTSTLAGLSGEDTSSFLTNIKANSGDLNKFNERLDGTNSQLGDLQDNLTKSGKAAKKAVEGLLSFDEVFKLPEKDSALSNGQLDIPDMGDYDFEVPEPPNWDEWMPELDTFDDWWDRLLNWFKNLNWADIASALGTGLLAGVKAGLEYFEKGAAVLFAKVFTKEQLEAMVQNLERNTSKLSFKEAFDSIVTKFKELPSKITKAASEFSFKDAFASIASKFKALPSTVASSVSSLSFKSAMATLSTKLKSVFTGLNFKSFAEGLKVGLKAAFLELGFDFIFEQIEEALRSAGLSWAANAVDNFGGPVAAALAAAIVTRNPFVIVGSAIITSIFNSIDDSLQTGDWSSTVSSIVPGIALVFTKFMGKGKAGVFAAVGSLIVEALFGTISDSLDEEGNTQGAEIADKVSNILSTTISGAAIGAAFGPIGAAVGAGVGAILGTVMSFWTEVSTWWTSTAWPFLVGLGESIQIALQPVINIVGPILTGIGAFFIDTFNNIQKALSTNFTSIKKIFDGIGQVLHGAWETFGGILGLICGVFSGNTDLINEALEKLRNGISKVFSGLGDIFTGFLEVIGNFFILISEGFASLSNIPGPLGIAFGLIGNIFNTLGNIIKTVGDIIGNVFDFIVGVFTGNGEKIKEASNNIYNIIVGLKDGIVNKWNEIINWFSNIPNMIGQIFSNAGRWLVNAGSNIVNGLSSGISNAWNSIVRFFSNLPRTIMNVFANAGTWLRNAGWNIITGFLNGLIESFRNVQNFIWGIGDWIVRNKGPEAYDKQLLVPAGKWIMGGFENSLTSSFAGVLDTVSTFGGQLQDAFGDPVLTPSIAGVQVPKIDSSKYTVAMPSSSTNAMYVEQGTNQTEDVPNPFIDTEVQSNSRPVVYVHTLIADKQALRDLKKELDVIELEDSRWR